MSDALPDPTDMPFDDAVTELEAIIERIDGDEITLEDAMAAHRRGRALLKRCRQVLETVTAELDEADLDDEAETD